MKVYLDMCALQRPLDDQSQLRIRVETEAVLGLLRLVEESELDLLWSEALDIEAMRAPLERQHIIQPIRALAVDSNVPVETLRDRALGLEAFGIRGMDALHAAAALELGVDRFATCDDRLLARLRRLDLGPMQALSVIELLMEVTA